ncbi:MAG: glycosyltransferase family 4 protein [Fluviicola sp.]|nr:glycosyltransferase family 4 protein [Fluviicola sp.]
MKIAVNTRFLLPTKMEGFGWYTFEIVKRIVEQHPEHEFIFFFDRKYDQKFIFGKNVIPVVLNPPARHPILFMIWFEIAVYRALKKHKVDLFFSPDGYLSLRSNIPQIGVIHDINFEHYPEDLPFSARVYLRFFFKRFAKKAKKIITVSNFSKEDIAKTYLIDSSKIKAIWNGASVIFQPIDQVEKLTIQTKYSKGKPYFLFVGAIHPRKNVKRLLEAYSIYKNNSSNDYELVIVGESLWNNSLDTSFLSEEHKKSIHFTGHLALNELAKVMGAASIFMFIPYFEGFGIPLVEAMKCGIPIIAGNKSAIPEVAGDAAIYCDPFDIKDISTKMEFLSNSTERQLELSKNGLQRSKIFSWDIAADKVWNELITD